MLSGNSSNSGMWNCKRVRFHFSAPNFEEVGVILVSACLCVCMEVRDIVLKLHVIPHGKIADAYFGFP